MRTRTRVVIALAGIMMAMATLAMAVGAQRRSPLPSELDDSGFWRLVTDLSEPDGYFEDENYVSNESGYQRSMQRLQAAITPGGIYLGVGPEQNFAYIAALRPTMAFIVDIRRQNMIEHLMYKALFELSDDRADFLSRLFSRPRPSGVDAGSSVEALFQAYGAASADRRLFEDTLARILGVLVDRHRFGLTTEDRASMRKVFNAFYESGPDLRYVFRGTAELHPTYAQMMTVADESGRHWSYLGTADGFQYIRQMQRRNLIVPVVGDFAGAKALKAIGAYVRDHGAVINVFYVSNVEPYLFGSGTWKAFYETVATLPLDESGLFIRAFFGSTAKACGALKPTIRTPVLGSMATLVNAYRSGAIKTQCDLVTASR